MSNIPTQTADNKDKKKLILPRGRKREQPGYHVATYFAFVASLPH